MRIEKAIIIAAEAHAGQQDKAGAPYILHPLRLMLQAEGEDARVVAVLHDVIEDSDWTMADLLDEGLTGVQAAGLDAVTRRDGESYDQFIQRAGADPLGRAVKILDLQDNCDLSRIAAPTPQDHERRARYAAALAQLST